MNKVFKVGLIGCGHIAETYFRGHQYFNNFKIVACADIIKQLLIDVLNYIILNLKQSTNFLEIMR